MKPEKKANFILKTTRSLAKMVEFNVPVEERKLSVEPPEKLFTLVIGILGDLSRQIIDSFMARNDVSVSGENARFCAVFFDSYKNSNRLTDLDNYSLLVGAVAYYFSNLPGSTAVLLNSIDKASFDLNAQGIEHVLCWIMQGVYTSVEDYSDSFYFSELESITSEIKVFFQTGSKDSERKLFDACIKLQKKVHNEGSPRELFLGDFVYAVIILKVQNSSWKNLPLFSGLSTEIWASTIKKDGFIKELWPAQLELGKEGVLGGQSVVVQMPTSAGKTKSTELIIRAAFLAQRTNIAVIIAPFNALCHEIKNDFFKYFRGEKNISIDEINDAFVSKDVSVFQDEKKHIVILTPEKLYYFLTQQNEFVSKIGLVVYDEGHQFDTGTRGVTYELLLTELKSMLEPNVQIVLISAVMSNANEIAQWMASDCKVVSGKIELPTQRSMAYIYGVSLSFFGNQNIDNIEFYAPKIINQVELPLFGREKKRKFFPNLQNASSIALSLAITKSIDDCVAIFLGTKRNVNPLLEEIVDYYKRLPGEKHPPLDNCERSKLLNLVRENYGDECLLFESIRFGVLTHHADLPQGIRLCVEYDIHAGLAKFLICTSTLAQGVNLPIKYLFIPSIRQGKTKIKVSEFHNLIGRVARAGKMTEGSIIFTDPRIESDFITKSNVNRLINPTNSEGCKSSLLELLNDRVLYVYDLKLKKEYCYPFSVEKWIDIYEKNVSILDFTNTICRQLKIEDVTVKNDFRIIVSRIYSYLNSLENFMLNMAESLNKIRVEDIAKSTFAYMLADDLGKNKLIYIFSRLKERVEQLGFNSAKIKVMSKTLRGINRALELEEFVQSNKEMLYKVSSCENFIRIISVLFTENFFSKKIFFAYPNKTLLIEAIFCWIKGHSYKYIYDNILCKEKIGRYNFTLEMCNEIFDECMSYDGPILINAISELLLNESIDVSENMEWFQKQIKYGLPSKESIILYEIGFCDRMLAQKLAHLFKGIENKKDMVIQLLIENDSVHKILADYPLYFEKCVYSRLSYIN